MSHGSDPLCIHFRTGGQEGRCPHILDGHHSGKRCPEVHQVAGQGLLPLVASSPAISPVQGIRGQAYIALPGQFIPKEVRISSYILVIATFVTLADMMLQAYAPVQHKELGAFIALIVVNCMILGRQEAFSSRNTVYRSLLDAIGVGIGFTIALVMMGGFREILGVGAFFDIPLFGPNFEPWVVMVLPAGGFLTLGFIILAMGLMVLLIVMGILLPIFDLNQLVQ